MTKDKDKGKDRNQAKSSDARQARAIKERPGNQITGSDVEQPPSGLRPGLGRDEDDKTAGGVGEGL